MQINVNSRFFEVNTNAVTTYFGFGGNEYQDLDGNPVVGGVTLDPFMSIVLILRYLALPSPPSGFNDYDGDGKSDLAVYRDGYWSIYLMAGSVLLDNAGPWGGADCIPVH